MIVENNAFADIHGVSIKTLTHVVRFVQFHFYQFVDKHAIYVRRNNVQ